MRPAIDKLFARYGTALSSCRVISLEQIAAAPVLASADDLLIEELSDEEDEAFAAAVRS